MVRTIVAVFSSRAEAEQVAEALTAEGIPSRDIRVADTSTRQEYESRGERGGGGFWNWLFGDQGDETWNADVDYYNAGMGRGGSVVRVEAEEEDAERVQRIMDSHGAQLDDRPARSDAVNMTSSRTGERGRPEAEDEVLPIVEEQLRIGKRAVTRAGVRVYTRVTERPVEQDVTLREERVNVERRPVDRPVGATDGDAFRERSIEFDETVEEPVVAKEARIVEEVVISKDVGERLATVRDTVRRTDAEVDRGDAVADRRGAFDDRDFRTHCESTFGHHGVSYEQFEPAYRYGYTIGSDRQHAEGDWGAAEGEARRRWEERNPGTWDRFRPAIRYAWERARGERRAA